MPATGLVSQNLDVTLTLTLFALGQSCSGGTFSKSQSPSTRVRSPDRQSKAIVLTLTPTLGLPLDAIQAGPNPKPNPNTNPNYISLSLTLTLTLTLGGTPDALQGEARAAFIEDLFIPLPLPRNPLQSLSTKTRYCAHFRSGHEHVLPLGLYQPHGCPCIPTLPPFETPYHITGSN